MQYCIRYVDLPYSINAMTILDENGFYNIYVNSRLNVDQQNKAVRHELCHIARDDFYSLESLEVVETMQK